MFGFEEITLSPEDIEEFGTGDGTDSEPIDLSGLNGADQGSGGFMDFMMDNWWAGFALIGGLALVLIIGMVVFTSARRAARNQRMEQDTTTAQQQVSNLGFDPSTLSVTASGYALAMDGGGRRIAVFHPRRPEVAPRLLGPEDVAGVQLDESTRVQIHRNSSMNHMGDGAGGINTMHSGNTSVSSTSYVDRLVLNVRTNDLRDPLVQIPFLDADSGNEVQGSRVHLEQLAAAKTWEARFQVFAQQLRRDV